jgi:hypothetical protein
MKSSLTHLHTPASWKTSVGRRAPRPNALFESQPPDFPIGVGPNQESDFRAELLLGDELAHKLSKLVKNAYERATGKPSPSFIYNLALLFGSAIGMHWGKNPGTAVWVALCGALFMAIHDLLEGLP